MNQANFHPLPPLSLTTSVSVGTALPTVQMRNLRPREVSDLFKVIQLLCNCKMES